MDKYSTNLTIIDKSIDDMLGSRTQGGRMEGTDKSTELWWCPQVDSSLFRFQSVVKICSDNVYDYVLYPTKLTAPTYLTGLDSAALVH